MLVHCLAPEWDAPAHVRAVMTTRVGGCSAAPFGGMNLGRGVGDKAADVERNRALIQSTIGARLVWLHQVHGQQVQELAQETENGALADASFTTQRGLACTVMIADCLPLLFTDRKGSVVAAVHAGWRGLAGSGGRGVIESAHAALGAVPAEDLIAWLGPCIGQDAFEVGPEVLAAFMTHDPEAAAMFKPGSPGKFHADLQGLARRKLVALGIKRTFGNDGSDDWCTHSNPSRFFSHRRDHAALGGSGRMVAAIWLE